MFAVAVVLLPALAFIVPVLLVRLISPRAGAVAAAIAIGLLATLVVLGAFDAADDMRAGFFMAVLALGTGLLAWCYVRFRVGSVLFALYLSATPVLFVALFLLTSGVQPIVFEDDPAVLGHEPVRLPSDRSPVRQLPLGALLRADGTIDSDRFPGFGRLAAMSTWYPQATTVATYTFIAVPAILTGRLPDPKPRRSPASTLARCSRCSVARVRFTSASR